MNIEKLKELKSHIEKVFKYFELRCAIHYETCGCSQCSMCQLLGKIKSDIGLLILSEQKPEMPKHKPDCSYEKSKGKDPIMPCTCDYTTRLEEYCQKLVCKTCGGCSGKVSTSATACDDCSPDRQNHTGESNDMINGFY